MKTRKNINCLSNNELHDLREAFSGLYQLPENYKYSFLKIAGYHGIPSGNCIHSNVGFLTWHRAYLLELEEALRNIKCNVTIPYWNWSSGSTTGIPSACRQATYTDRIGNTVPNPLYSGPKHSQSGGGQTSRSNGINNVSFGGHATQAQVAISSTSWSSFISQLNNVHGWVHGTVGGDMGGVANAGFDPIFWFHHCNVDRLGANWQAQNPTIFPSSEATKTLEPFRSSCSSQWHVGLDFQNISDWDYQYNNRPWCYIIVGPIEWDFTDRFVLRIVTEKVTKKNKIEIVFSSKTMPEESIELRVYEGDKKITTKNFRKFDKEHLGSLYMFGMGEGVKMKSMDEKFTVSLDITDSVQTLRGKSKSSLHYTLVAVSNPKLKGNKEFLNSSLIDVRLSQ